MNKDHLKPFFLSLVIVCFFIDLQAQPQVIKKDSLLLINQTFLGGEKRAWYGKDCPSQLDVIWKHYLGKGKTVISRKLGERIWSGAGWTGQPLMVQENNRLFLIQGAYDHNLKKIDANTGKLIWQYTFDDVIKGTGTFVYHSGSDDENKKLYIVQGSRLGVGNYLDSKHIPSYRAVSFNSGNELWRLDVKWTHSYSRDVDGSAIVINDTIYAALENSLLTLLHANPSITHLKDSMQQPVIIDETRLYSTDDVKKHGGNVVTESSPSRLGDRLFIASGSGHVFGYNLKTKKLDWDFYIGSDMDGSVVVTHDSCILVSVEKQYIDGQGGVFKLNPARSPEESVEWYFPTNDTSYFGWEGGVIGTVGINDYTKTDNMPYLAAINALDGKMYVVNHMQIDSSKKVPGPNKKHVYPTPKVFAYTNSGPSISTPLFAEDKLVTAGYKGIYLYQIMPDKGLVKLDRFPGEYESTPFIWNRHIYVASRNGYLYCFSEE